MSIQDQIEDAILAMLNPTRPVTIFDISDMVEAKFGIHGVELLRTVRGTLETLVSKGSLFKKEMTLNGYFAKARQ